jgi:very-short-patch-repair endonuclease
MMLVLPQKIEVKWQANNKKNLISKGFSYTKMNDVVEIDILDLSISSNVKVKVLCDYCNKIFDVTYNNYNRQMENSYTKKYACSKCSSIKVKETNICKYGVENVHQRNDIKEKIRNTNIEKYGVDNPAKSNIIKEKIKSTSLEKYGVEHHLKRKSVWNQIKETNLKKYGVEYISQNEEIKEKIRQTNLKRYGSECNLNNPEIRKMSVIKSRKTLYENGNTMCSKQQKYLQKLLGGELNYPIDRCSLDIAFPNEMIYIEYDGGGHDLSVKLGLSQDEFDKKESKRKFYLQSKGWKLIRIISNNDLLPEDIEIQNLIMLAKEYLNNNHSWFHININENKIKCSQYELSINLKKLRRIREEI